MTIQSFFNNRWQIDAGKFYLAVAFALLFVSINSYFYSFAAPPESTLSVISGRLEQQKMRRGNYLHVWTSPGIKTTFTCNRGSEVYCPSIESRLADGKAVQAYFSSARPELLLKLSTESGELLSYARMAKIYRFRGLPLFMLVGGVVFAVLFCSSPYIHRKAFKASRANS